DPRSVALSPEIRHCESSGERDGLPVVSIVEHTDEHAIAHERVARSVLLVSENEAVDDRGIGHSSTLGHRDTQRLVLTRADILRHNPPMTTNARPLSAQEANRTAGMMMPGCIGMCCRMCS